MEARRGSLERTLLRDITDYATFSNVTAVVLSLDQEKAFDRGDWSFMLGIRDGLRSILSSMSPFSFYRCSGLCSCQWLFIPILFVLSRGVRQDCPLSPLLYDVFSEVLNI